MKKNVPANKNGAILVIVMAVLVAFSLMVVALLQLGSFNQMETVRHLRMTQAHWLAEAGLERGLSRVMGSKTYRDDLPDTFSETLLDGQGSYEVEITRDYISSVLDTYTITSIGSAGNNAMVVTNTVRLRMNAGPGGQQAILGLGGDSEIAQNVNVYGTIYQDPSGTLAIAGGSGRITDIVDAKIGGDPAGKATTGELPDPGPPRVNQTTYSNWLVNASSTNPSIAFQGSYSGPFNLATAPSNTININGDVNIANNVIGSGKIVANGAVTFNVNGTTIADHVKIVAASDINISANNITFGKNDELFTMSNLHLGGNQNLPWPGLSLLAIGDITISANIGEFKGIIYAEGSVDMASGNKVIRGTIIAWEGFTIGQNTTIYYDPSVFANPLPIDYGNQLAIMTNTWQWAESPF